MSTLETFASYFQGPALDFLLRAVDLSLDEDGPDLTSSAVFGDADRLLARIVAKQQTLVAGLPMVGVVLDRMGVLSDCEIEYLTEDGLRIAAGTVAARFSGPAVALLKAERVILNFLCHMSGVSNLTATYVEALKGSRTRLLDTRKTLPGMRYPEKYAVLMGGGTNHRRNLGEMLMLKDNHVDQAGGVPQAVAALRRAFAGREMPPLEIECRRLDEVAQAVELAPRRIMLDNMTPQTMAEALRMIPDSIETEVSGGVGLEALGEIAALGADFVSVGRITHSAPYADFSMQLASGTE